MKKTNENLDRYEFSKEQFLDSGLVLRPNESYKDFKERKNKMLKSNINISMDEIRGIFLAKIDNEPLLQVREETDGFNDGFYDGTAHYKFKLKKYLGIENLCAQLQALYTVARMEWGITLNPRNTSIPPLILIASKNQFASLNEDVEKEYINYISKEIPQFENLDLTIQKTLAKFYSFNELNFVQKITNSTISHVENTELHEGIHAIFFNNQFNTQGKENYIILESTAHIISSNIQITSTLDKLNNKYEVYNPQTLTEIQQEFRELCLHETKLNLKECYGPIKPEDETNKFLMLKYLHEKANYNSEVDKYSNALHNCIESYVNKNEPMTLAIHDAISFSFKSFTEKYKRQ